MKKKSRRFDKSVPVITKKLNEAFPKAKNVLTEKIVRDKIHDGTIPTEPRASDREPYRIDVTSCDAMIEMIGDQNVDLVTIQNGATHIRKSETHMKRLMKAGAPYKKPMGRVIFCTTSLDHYEGQRTTRKRKPPTDVTGGTNL